MKDTTTILKIEVKACCASTNQEPHGKKKQRKNPFGVLKRNELDEEAKTMLLNFRKRLKFMRLTLKKEQRIYLYEFAAFLGLTEKQYAKLENDELKIMEPDFLLKTVNELYKAYGFTWEDMVAECIEDKSPKGTTVELWKEPIRKRISVVSTYLKEFLINYRSYEK